MYRYSATQWIFGNEDIETSFARLKKFGYDGVELAAEPYDLNMDKIKQLMAKYDMICTSLCGIFTPERDLSSTNEKIRAKAVIYLKDSVDMALFLGATHIIVVPSPVGKLAPDTTTKEAWDNAVKSVREAGEYARLKNIVLAIEAINRYETYLVNNLTLALSFIREVNISSVKVMADLFHMNIEERNNTEALTKIAPYLAHVHIADNTREAAGLGKTDFSEVMRTLKKINYKGPITMEFLPPIANPYLASGFEQKGEIYDDFAEQSIHHMKMLEKLV